MNNDNVTRSTACNSMPALERNPWLTDITDNPVVSDDVAMDTNTTTQNDEMQSNETPASTLTVPLPSPSGSMFQSEVPFGPVFMPIVPMYQDSLAKNSVEGVCGLHNLGNTCFMNAGLQCLVCNPQLVSHFLDQFQPNIDIPDTPTNKFAEILRKIWSGQYSVLNTSEFKDTLGIYHPQFKDFRQHDCQEFIALLLDSLHEQLNIQNEQSKQNQVQQLEDDSSECTPQTYNINDISNQSNLKSPLNNQSKLVQDMEQVKQEELEMKNYQGSDSDTSTLHSKSTSLSSVNTEHTLKLHSDDSNQSNSSLQNNDEINQSDFSKLQSEDSNQSGSSLHSNVDMHQSDSLSHRTDTIPQDINSFSDQINPAISSADNCTEEPAVRKLPTVEDIYMKDNKVLNTNVSEFEEEEVTVDSEKYHKPDNINPTPMQADDLIILTDATPSGIDEYQIQFEREKGDNVTQVTTARDEKTKFKPLKETNLLVNHNEKFPEQKYSKKLFSECQDSMDELDADCNINNIKRIKIDEEGKKEKNVRMQQMMKMNLDKSPQVVKVDICERETSENRTVTVNLLDDQMLKQLSPQGPQRVPQAEIVGMSPSSQLTFNNEAHLWGRYIVEADREWRKYLQKNRTIVVDSFQGQFKSTVVCSECYHISVTFEPFMYLSVPLPHAMERQISVIFLPCDSKQPIRYLVTLNKNDKISMLKMALRKLINEEECDVVIAEVLSNHISRILEDNVMLRYINDDTRTLYAFEMLPAPSISDVVTNEIFNRQAAETNKAVVLPNNVVSSSSTVSTALADSSSQQLDNIFYKNGEKFGVSTAAERGFDNYNNSAAVSSSSCMVDQQRNELLNNSLRSSTGCSVSTSHADLEFRTDVHWQTNLLTEPDTTTASSTVNASTSVSNGDNINTNFCDVSPRFDGFISSSSDVTSPHVTGDDMVTECGDPDMTDVLMEEDQEEKQEVDKWRSCAICLEEMADNDLMIHTSCGGTLCHTCLDMSFKHYGEAAFICPVCSCTVNPSEDFVQVNLVADYKPKTRILSVPVMQRHEECAVSDKNNGGKLEMELFGHPNLLYLPSELGGDMLYNHVDRVVPVLTNYNIVVTDGQGLRCSRCLYTDHCTGCPVTREEDIALQPGDHLTVCFTGLDRLQRENAASFVDHKSMEESRSNVPLTLFDCFTAFTQCEILDEHNPWYCPSCCKNQCANKTMTVWRYPRNLVVYLKRFVFHELMSNKIDNKVIFPVEDMDLSPYISGPRNVNLKYSLQSCVCHFGGVTSGHYTAYAQHPISKKWFYYNDETVTEKVPQEDDYSSAYVLFYQRQGEDVAINIPSKKIMDAPTDVKPATVWNNSTSNNSAVRRLSAIRNSPPNSLPDTTNMMGCSVDTLLPDTTADDTAPAVHDFYS